MSKKGKKPFKFTHKDVDKEWQEHVKRRAVEQNVTEDEVIRYGLHFDFKAKKREEETLEVLKAIRDELKKAKK